MEIFLSSASTVKDINREFKKIFPLLRLEFYKRNHNHPETSAWEQKFPERSLLKDINKQFRPGMIKFNPDDTVAELEQRFQRNFGLPVQVCRQMGEVYVETVETDDLSLRQQNSMGHIAERPAFNVNTLFL